MSSPGACDACLARSWLIARLAPHLERQRGRAEAMLALGDEDLLAALGGRRQEQLWSQQADFSATVARDRIEQAGLAAVCRCQPDYPRRMAGCDDAPAVLYVAGEFERFRALAAGDAVAIAGARRASSYGIAVAAELGRGLGVAGVCVISGMAFGIDRSAHQGALGVDGPTIAVVPGGAECAYPRSHAALHRAIVRRGAVISETPPGGRVWRWALTARNRIVAALAAMTVIVEAEPRSGSLVTARRARELGRSLGAVPGAVTSPLARGPNELLAGGATVVRGADDVLDALFGPGARAAAGIVRAARPRASPAAQRLYDALARGQDVQDASAAAGLDAEGALAALAELELGGWVARGPGGRYTVLA